MLPVNLSTDYVTFFESFKTKTDEEKESAIRQAVAFVQLTYEEIEAMVSFVVDKNGVPYSSINFKDLKPDDIFEIIVSVAMEVGRIKVELVSENEKKKSPTTRSTSDGSF
jgi:hypothetical protein